MKTGKIFPAEFEDKGPNPMLRSARIFGDVQAVSSCCRRSPFSGCNDLETAGFN